MAESHTKLKQEGSYSSRRSSSQSLSVSMLHWGWMGFGEDVEWEESWGRHHYLGHCSGINAQKTVKDDWFAGWALVKRLPILRSVPPGSGGHCPACHRVMNVLYGSKRSPAIFHTDQLRQGEPIASRRLEMEKRDSKLACVDGWWRGPRRRLGDGTGVSYSSGKAAKCAGMHPKLWLEQILSQLQLATIMLMMVRWWSWMVVVRVTMFSPWKPAWLLAPHHLRAEQQASREPALKGARSRGCGCKVWGFLGFNSSDERAGDGGKTQEIGALGV
ncbi:hypothetical protein QBC45DRAFT_107941 [Copromyces sp. CBS 386.78]|nr:hypothetical protein QBC45DRAFT_107941 [Copromyces sp. CBS 386.78]